jgi:hypothetical protein
VGTQLSSGPGLSVSSEGNLVAKHEPHWRRLGIQRLNANCHSTNTSICTNHIHVSSSLFQTLRNLYIFLDSCYPFCSWVSRLKSLPCLPLPLSKCKTESSNYLLDKCDMQTPELGAITSGTLTLVVTFTTAIYRAHACTYSGWFFLYIISVIVSTLCRNWQSKNRQIRCQVCWLIIGNLHL